jgi:hypothetical protein
MYSHSNSKHAFIIYALPRCVDLPLGLLPLQETLQDRNDLLQTCQPNPQLRSHLLHICTQLRIKVLTVRSRRHGGAENGLHHEGMVGLEGAAIGISEGGRELLTCGSDVLGEGDGREIETSGGMLAAGKR